MKKIILLILFAFVFTGSSNAFDLEKINKAAPAAIDYPSSSALILKDYISYEYRNDGVLIQSEDEVIKILNASAISRFGEVEYLYNPEQSEIIVEEAKILTADGKLIKAVVTEESPFNKTGIFGNLMLKKIKFPNISVDAVIEYNVKNISKKPEFANNFWGISYFQDYEPIIESVLTVKVPASKRLFYKNFGQYKPDVSIKTKNNETIYTWRSSNNPPLVKEAAAPPSYNLASQVRFSTIKSWDEFSKYYWNMVAGSKSMSFNVNEVTEKITAGLKTNEEKIKAIYDYIVKNYINMDLGFNSTGFKPHKADEVIKYQMGTSNDLAALFINMLKICNIEAYPAFVCTRNYANAKPDIVYPSQFDRCLAVIPSGKTFRFIDTSSAYNSIDNISTDIQGQSALIMAKNKAHFCAIPVMPASFNKEEISVEAIVDQSGEIKEGIRVKESGANSALLRKFFSGFDDLYRRIILVLMARSIAPQSLPIDIYFSGIENIDEPYNISFIFKAKDFIDTELDLMYFTLPMFPLQNIINMVAEDDKERIYPVVINSTISSSKKIRIILPENFDVKGLPRPIKIKNSVGFYEYSCGFEKNAITAKSVLVIDKIEVPLVQYKQLKDLIEAAVDTERQLIVVKKKI